MTDQEKIKTLAIYASHLYEQDISWVSFATAILAKVDSMDAAASKQPSAPIAETKGEK